MEMTRVSRTFAGLCGLFGAILLGAYFGVGFSLGLAQLGPSATTAQVINAGVRYHDLWLLGTWLQATGSMLCVVFFVALVARAGAASQLAGMLTLLGSAVLLSVVLIEGACTLELAMAAVNGHVQTAQTSFDLMTVFTYLYALAPAPLIFLSLGALLLRSPVLPREFGFLALALGIAFEVVGLIGLFTTPILTVIVLGCEALWVLAAALTLLLRPEPTHRGVAVQQERLTAGDEGS